MSRRYIAGEKGTCPHCRTTVRFLEHASFVDQFTPREDGLRFAERGPEGDEDKGRTFALFGAVCPECNQSVVSVETYEPDIFGSEDALELTEARLIWPIASARPTLPASVPEHLRADYQEAAQVLGLSDKASAALSRRCLQSLLREAAGTRTKDLARQIDEVLPHLPSHLRDQLDAVRHIGNFAAHTQKSKATGQIIDVEPGEAEWTLDVLDMLFDFYYEQPKIAKQKRDALNKKLAEAGKPPMK